MDTIHRTPKGNVCFRCKFYWGRNASVAGAGLLGRFKTVRCKFYWGGDLTVAGAGLLGRFVVQIGSGNANLIGEEKSCTVAISEWRCETYWGAKKLQIGDGPCDVRNPIGGGLLTA